MRKTKSWNKGLNKLMATRGTLISLKGTTIMQLYKQIIIKQQKLNIGLLGEKWTYQAT